MHTTIVSRAVLSVCLCLSLMLGTSAFAYNASDIIATYAGNGSAGYVGDGGPAVSAALNQPYDITTDASGNVYVADIGSNTVRKISTAGIITTIAGTGVAGYNGDNILAVTAQLNEPRGLAVDTAGDLYIADLGNHRVRKITFGTGLITTVTGTGTAGCSNGIASLAVFNAPVGLAFDTAGALYISDVGTGTVRKLSSGTVTAFAGSCTQSVFELPNGLTTDPSGNVYVTDAAANRVWIVNSAGVLTLFAGNGSFNDGGDGSAANSSGVSLESPFGVARDTTGNIFIGSGAVVRVVTTDGIIHTAAGSGAGGYSGDGGLATSASIGGLAGIGGVAVNASGRLFITDPSNTPNIRITGPAAAVFVAVVGGDAVTSADLRINCPSTCAANYVSGMPVILDASTASFDVLYQWSGKGCHPGAACTVFSQTLTPVPVTARFTPWYIKTLLGGTVGPALHSPFALAFDASGNLYFTEISTCQVRKRTPGGTLSVVAGNGTCGDLGDGMAATQSELNDPQGIAVDSSGNVYIQDTGNSLLRKVTTDGILHTVTGGLYPGNSPALVIDAAGDVFVPGSATTIIRVTPDGVVHPFATLPSDHVTSIYGLAIDARSGLIAYGIYQTDSSPVLAHISAFGMPDAYYTPPPNVFAAPDGLVTDHRDVLFNGFVCGVFSIYPWMAGAQLEGLDLLACGYTGDGGPASSATLNSSIGTAFDANGWLYVADNGNNAIRVFYPDGIFTGSMEP